MSITVRPYIALSDCRDPVLLAWPRPGDPGGFVHFDKGADWRDFVNGLGIDPRIPDIVRAKFAHAQQLYMLGWYDFSLVKDGELAALIALELALMDRYGHRVAMRKRNFAALLKHMVVADGLTDATIPMVARCGGTAVGQLTGEVHPTLAERRNALAHGTLFEGPPTGGLLELARDLINYAYRDFIARAASLPAPTWRRRPDDGAIS